jgi:hypothetical protein
LGANEHAPRARAGGRGVAQHGRARDPDVGDPVRQAGRLLERGAVGDVRREQHEVGDHAGPDEAAVGQAEALGRQGGHVPDRLLQREPALVARDAPEIAREGAEAARVRPAALARQAVGAQHVQPVRERRA